MELSIIVPLGPGRDGQIALTSLLMQETVPAGVEVVVVLDRGVPHEVWRKLSQRMCLRIIDSRIRGAAAARNLGFDSASPSDLCWFLDDDDEVVLGGLPVLMESVREVPDRSAWSFPASFKSGAKPKQHGAVRGSVHASCLLKRNTLGGCSSVVVNSDAFRAVGGFDPDFESMQDWDLYIRLERARPIFRFNIPIVIYDDVGAGRISSMPSRKRAGLVRLLAKHRASFDVATVAFHETRILFYDCVLGLRRWPALLNAPHRTAGIYYLGRFLRYSLVGKRGHGATIR